MKYDDASWHYGGDFPQDLPDEAGATHIAMFVAWCVLNGMAGALHLEDFADDAERLRARACTPGTWFMNVCDGKFTDEDVNEEGNAFAASYYAYDGSNPSRYVSDYERVLGAGLPSLYHVPDTWTSYDLLAPVIVRRFEAFKAPPPAPSLLGRLFGRKPS